MPEPDQGAEAAGEATVRRPRLMAPMAIASAAVTHRGRVRRINEDAALDRADLRLWAVADGVGGAEAGDYASAAIVHRLSQLIIAPNGSDPVEETRRALHEVNAQLYQEAVARRARRGIASTVVCLLIRDTRFFCLWAGDSRLYRWRGQFEQLSRDHSEVQSLLDYGLITAAEALRHPRANIITRAVGAQPTLLLDCIDGTIDPGDRFLLCSDGLTRVVDDAEIAAILAGFEPAEVAQRLVRTTLDRGAPDNVTVIAVRTSLEPG